MGRSCRYIRVAISHRVVGIGGVGIRVNRGVGIIRAGWSLSVGDVSRVTAVHVRGASGMVHVTVPVGRSCRYVAIRVAISSRVVRVRSVGRVGIGGVGRVGRIGGVG